MTWKKIIEILDLSIILATKYLNFYTLILLPASFTSEVKNVYVQTTIHGAMVMLCPIASMVLRGMTGKWSI